MSFVHLHVHSDYSLLQAPIGIKSLIQRVKHHAMTEVALTDLDTLSGILPFYQSALSRGIKPIIGCEIHVAPHDRKDKSGGLRASGAPLVLLARNNQGFHNLIQLITDAALTGFYYRPRTDKETLRSLSDGLIALSGNRFSEIQNLILNSQIEQAKETVGEFQSIFGEDNFFLELVNHGSERHQSLIGELKELGQQTGSPLVATNDVYALTAKDIEAMTVMQCIANGKTLEEARQPEGPLLHLSSAEEMIEKFKDVPEAIENTQRIADRCNVELDFKAKHMPIFTLSEEVPPSASLHELVEQGLHKRFQNITPEIRERVDHELQVINQLDFASYFLIVWDFIRYAKEQNIPVGPGRGSCVGSLVSYCLEITDINPLDYDLLFERFLNPDRIGDPDIDIDICREGREQIIDYVRSKYGQDSVAQIATFGTLGAKAVVRDVGRVLNIPLSEVNAIAKAIPNELKMTLGRAWDESPDLKKLIESSGAYQKLWELSCKLEGLHRHISIHAAAVVIADAPLTHYIPLTRSRDTVITQYGMDDVDASGILKMDFLGLKTLTIIDRTVRYLEGQGHTIKLDEISLDDAPTYQMLQQGESRNTFQYESAGMRDLMVKMKPDRFEDLIATIALYRPGPLNSGMVDDFVARKHGQQDIVFSHPLLEPILKDTYGVIIFQEQAMLIAHHVAGFSLSEADHLRKAMAKKKPELMMTFREKFHQGAKKNNIPENIYKDLFNLIEKFAEYGFNKSHSAGYALISYWTCYLKANFPGAYMSAVMSCDASNNEKIAEAIAECKRMDLDVKPPDINSSDAGFTLDGESTIRFGLEAVKGVGSKAIESILKRRNEGGPFKNFYDFCLRVDLRVTNKSVIEALVKSGAFDSLPGHRAQFMAAIEPTLKIASQAQSDQNIGQGNLFEDMLNDEEPTQEILEDVPPWSEAQALAFERETIGFYLTNHPLNQYEEQLVQFTSANLSDLKEIKSGEIVTIGGLVTTVKPLTTKKGRNPGQRMCALTLEDLYGQAEAVLFPDAFEKSGSHIQEDAVIFLKGKLDKEKEIPKIIVEEAFPIKEALTRPPPISNGKASGQSELLVQIPESQLQDHLFADLKKLFQAHPGPDPILIEVLLADGQKETIHAGRSFFVELSANLREELKHLVGKDNFRLQSLVK